MRIREVMKEKGVKAESLADTLGVTVSSLNQSISGNPSVKTLEKIADALGVSITELFEKRQEPTFACPHCGKRISLHIDG